MKKIIIIFIVIFGSAVCVNAQLNTLLEQETPAGFSEASNVVYVECYGRRFAVYHVAGNGEKFRITEITNYYTGTSYFTGNYTSTYEIDVMRDYWISDLAVYGSYVFFCGKKNMGGSPVTTHGVLGWFDIGPFVASGTPFVVNYEEVPAVCRINKITVYQPGASLKVVAIGENDYPVPGSPTREFIIIEADFTGTFSSIDFRPLWNNYATSGRNLEVAYELIKTNNYLAIIGYHELYSALSIRRCNPLHVITDPAMDNIYYYPSVTHDVLSQTHSTAMEPTFDEVQVSYLTQSSSGTSFSTCVREIDLSTMIMKGSQEVPTDEKSEPIVLKYMHSTGLIMLAQSFVFPSWGVVNTNFVNLKPHSSSSYWASVVYKKGFTYNVANINYVNTRDMIAVSSNYDFFMHDMSFSGTPSTVGCPDDDVISVYPLAPVSSNVMTDYQASTSCSFFLVTDTPSVNPCLPLNTCESH